MASSILIVEDEPSIAELIAVNLSHAGFLPVRAFQTEQASQLIKEVLPDLVILDWMLPGQSGVQFAKQLRSHERTKDIPIILLTARSDEMDKIAGLEAGADDYVTKPFSPKELVARVRAVLRRRSPQLADDLVQINQLKLDPVSHRVMATQDGIEVSIDLGPTEFKLLHLSLIHI